MLLAVTQLGFAGLSHREYFGQLAVDFGNGYDRRRFEVSGADL